MSLVTNIDHIFKKGVIGNVRKAQEDSHDMKLKTPNGDVFVVCDGMGGHVGGAKASSLAVESIVNYLKAEKYADPISALDGALKFANMQILGFANSHPEYSGMGTTACIVLMQAADVWIAHVGDSRIYLYLGKEKELHRITKDHSYVQTLVDAGTITDEEAETHPHKNRILKALGITPDLQPSFNPQNNPIHPKNGDIFLICSDGLSGMIPDSTIEKVLGQNGNLEEKGELLIRLAMEGETVQPGGQDNCTLELVEIDNSPWPKSEFVSFNPSKSVKKKDSKSFSKIVKIIATIVSVIVVLGVVGVCVNRVVNRNKIAQEEKSLKGKKDNLAQLDKNLSNAQKDVIKYDNEDQKKQKEAAEKRVKELEESIKNIKKDTSDIRRRIDSLKQQNKLIRKRK